jgi:enoyl-CoA hydratase
MKDRMMTYQYLLTEVHDTVAVIRFNRPQVRNALCGTLIRELGHALDTFEQAAEIKAIVLTGDDRAFAAGADIGEMAAIDTFADAYRDDFNAGDWIRLTTCRKPVIAAVAGYALGGGCELAMMCDFILASPSAKFGQLEVTVGIPPGGGGTQRLPRFIGKSKAMEMCLTGRIMDAAEAERAGLVSRVIPDNELVDEAIRTAARIARLSQPVVMMIKECVDRAYETPLAEGLRYERRSLHAAFALSDRKEGMNAFVEKREPAYKNC